MDNKDRDNNVVGEKGGIRDIYNKSISKSLLDLLYKPLFYSLNNSLYISLRESVWESLEQDINKKKENGYYERYL